MARKDSFTDWDAIEPHYRAGILTYAQLSAKFNVSAPAILKHFRRANVTRDLQGKIRAKAQDVVNAAEVNKQRRSVNQIASEAAVVDANASVLAEVAMTQRHWSRKAMEVVTGMLDELERTMEAPEVFAQVHAALAVGEDPDPKVLNALASLVSSLPEREKVARGLIESLHRTINTQRLVFGMDERQKPIEDADSYETLLDAAKRRRAAAEAEAEATKA